MTRDPVPDAADLVEQMFPQACWALVTGSVVGARRTPGSDLDIVVLLPDGDPQAPHRNSLRFRGWPVELFVHDSVSLAYYLAKDVSQRRPSLHRMVALGVPVKGEPGARQAACARVLEAGPQPLTPTDRDHVRYMLTDLLDDYLHASAEERPVVAATLWLDAASAALNLADHWVGTGKWRLRELRDLDEALAQRWLAARDDPADFAREVLDQAGGPLFEGHRVAGERPTGAPHA
jgi:hypothetical protein